MLAFGCLSFGTLAPLGAIRAGFFLDGHLALEKGHASSRLGRIGRRARNWAAILSRNHADCVRVSPLLRTRRLLPCVRDAPS